MVNLANFDLNLLRVLDALLQEGSTVKAAARLGLSQSAVSAALSRLRAALGDELFFRRGQGLEPTAYALGLELRLRQLLDEVESLFPNPVNFDPARAQDRFRLSGSDFFAELLMPQLAAQLSRVAPGMRVHLVDLVPDSYVDTIERYDVDLALIPKMDMPDWIKGERVFRSAFVVVARKGNPRLARAGVAPGAVIPVDLFCDLGHVLFSPEGKASAMGDVALEKVGRSRNVVMTMPVFSGVYRAVAGSNLIALLPRQLAYHVAEAVGIEIYQPPMPVSAVEIMMIWHRRFDASPAHRWLRTQIAALLVPLDGT